ncbi:hypothetical protein K491DRAFT_684935 [Lophiostoma macrostomum CBS 122681]|uniref:Uncharacterized protein n=1 Tax=Lophiostoma macrostomum CBS 122681 TaxID=1314788 RepID=A0A6A6SMB4_9PLEO|nr:hypothetical protein K491DRAFT_684935 [Lophiostoma macrostomum CBS 122681]
MYLSTAIFIHNVELYKPPSLGLHFAQPPSRKVVIETSQTWYTFILYSFALRKRQAGPRQTLFSAAPYCIVSARPKISMPKAQIRKSRKGDGPYSNKAKATKPIADIVLELASPVALELSQKTTWSFWHIWDHCRVMDEQELSSEQQLERYKADWRKPHKFGTCIDIAHLAQQRLQKALRNHRNQEVRALSNQVTMMALWGGEDDDLEVAHCVAALFLPDCCIVIDTVYELDAFQVPLDGSHESMQHISFDGVKTHETYYYAKDDTGDFVLRQAGILSEPKDPAPEYVPVSYEEALQEGNFRIGRMFNRGNSGIPNRRHLNVNKVMKNEPEAIDSIPVSGGWLAVTMRMSMDYAKRSILVQVPQRDYLGLRDKEKVLHSLDRFGIVTRIGQSVSNIELKLMRKGKVVSERIDAVAEVVRDLGMAEVEFRKVVDSVATYGKRTT